MARPRRRPPREDTEDTAAQPSSNQLAHASGPQVAEDHAVGTRSTAPVARKPSQAAGSKASKGTGTVREKGNGNGRRHGAAAPKTKYNPSDIWRPGDPKLESWQFLNKEQTGVLKMTDPRYSHDRHFYMLPEGPKSALKSKRVPKEDRAELTTDDLETPTSWSNYFYDALYGHPQAIPKPARQPKDCRILGLFNSDLIIDATSQSRPPGMYWTFNHGTRMLQHIKPRGIKSSGGTIKEPEIPIDQVGRFIGHKGPAPNFGMFPQEGAIHFPIEIDGNEIISFDGGAMVGDEFVRKSDSARLPRKRTQSSRQIDIYGAIIGNDGKPTNLAVLKTKGRKRVRFALDGPDAHPSDSSSSSSSDSSDSFPASKKKKKRQKVIADSMSDASSLFLRAYSVSIYESSRQAAFKAVLGRKRKAKDTLEQPSSKRSRNVLLLDQEDSHDVGVNAQLAKTVMTSLTPFFATFSRSIYQAARKAAFTAAMKKRKAEEEIVEPSSKRSCPDNSEQGEQERFDALRTVVGIEMATAIRDLLRRSLLKATADFRRRKRISWSPSSDKHDSDNDHDTDDHGGGQRGVMRETEEHNRSRQASDTDNDEDNNHEGGEDVVREIREHSSPRQESDEFNDEDSNEDNNHEGDEDATQEVTEMNVSRQGSDNETAPVAGNDRTMGGSNFDWGVHPPVHRDEDDDEYVIRTDKWSPNGKESQLYNKLCNEKTGDEKDGTKEEETEAETISGPNNSTELAEPEPEVTEAEVVEPEAAEPEVAEPELAEPEVAEPELAEPELAELELVEPELAEPEAVESEVAEAESPIDPATLYLIAAEQGQDEIDRTILRNIAEANDPVARERLRLEELERMEAKQEESEAFEKSLLDDSDEELSGFDDGDGGDDEEEDEDSDDVEDGDDDEAHDSE
ncbi:hypothetical protein Vi05172_g3864 [Venturia inaequalis]|nr:hypothetical protein Vi05172_g3864 [Venturia inaequalis]